MSIYSTDYEIGTDEDNRPTGDVLAYRGSHVFPEPDDVRGSVVLASIPGHCVPGGPVDDFDHVGGFLRLDVMQNVDMLIDATVVLTVAGATLLRDQLTAWLDRPKLDAPTVPAPVLEREDDAPSGVAGHDEQCEAEYLAEATGWLPCGCADRATEDVREPLARAIDPAIYYHVNRPMGDAWRASLDAADAILRSFDVTPKGQSNG